jgi:hypothetical protein
VGSDRSGEFSERGRDAPTRPGFDAEFVVAVASVLHQSVTAHDHPGCVVALESAHRSEPGFEPAVVGFATNGTLRAAGTNDASSEERRETMNMILPSPPPPAADPQITSLTQSS